MPVRVSEFFGYLLGYVLGAFFAAGSFLRNARILHPRGILFCGELEPVPDSPLRFPTHVLIRFSGGWWKYNEWPDALGIAIRLSERKITSVVPGPGDRDFLFASFRRPWELFLSPMLTEQHDFQMNSYFSISPFELSSGEKVEFMIDPSRGHRSGGNRNDRLLGNVLGGGVVLRLMMKAHGQKSWKPVARIVVKDEQFLDQESLRFHPFMCGDGIRPYGFIQHLRLGTYRMSQWARPGAESVDLHSGSASPS